MSEKVIFTNMCMIYDDNKVVVIDRKKKDFLGITFPGGYVEIGESFTDAVIREVQEETGLTIHSPRICGIKDWYDNSERYVVLLYKANKLKGTLKSSKEGCVWWEDIDNFSNLSLAKDMSDMIRVFKESDLSEFFYYKNNNEWNYDLK